MEHKVEQGILSTCRFLGLTTGRDPGVCLQIQQAFLGILLQVVWHALQGGRVRVEVKINREASVCCQLLSSS